MTPNEFKDEYIKWYYAPQRLKAIEEDIDNLYYELTGVKGYNYAKVPTSFNPSISEEKRLEIIDFINIKIAELKSLKQSYEHMNLIMPKFTSEEFTVLYRLLIRKESYEAIGKEFGYSASSMWRYVESFIESAINSD